MVVPTRNSRIFPPRRARSPDRAASSPPLPLAVILRRHRRRRISTAPGGIYRSTRRYQPCAGGEILRAAQDDTSSGIRLPRDRRMPPSPQGEGRGGRPMVVPTRKARIFPPHRARSPDRAASSPPLPLAVVLRRLRRRRISTAPGGIYHSTRRYQPCAGGEILRAAQNNTSSGIRLPRDRRMPPSPQGEGRGGRPMVVPTGKARIFPPRRARSPDRAVPSPFSRFFVFSQEKA